MTPGTHSTVIPHPLQGLGTTVPCHQPCPPPLPSSSAESMLLPHKHALKDKEHSELPFHVTFLHSVWPDRAICELQSLVTLYVDFVPASETQADAKCMRQVSNGHSRLPDNLSLLPQWSQFPVLSTLYIISHLSPQPTSWPASYFTVKMGAFR